MTDRITALPERGTDARRASAAAAAFSGGVVAAALGLGALAVTVLFLWITSPFPDSGLDGALRIAADLWLLAHGADLVRSDTLSGVPAPIGVTPLLLVALPAYLLYRAAGHAVARVEGDGGEGGEGGDAGDVEGAAASVRPVSRVAAAAAGWLVAGYLLVGVAVVLYASSYGQVRGDPLSAVLHLPVVAVLAVAAGAWSACGRPMIELPRFVRRRFDERPLPRWLSPPEGGVTAALRAGAAAAAVLVGGGALLGAASLVWHARLAGHAFTQLSAPLSGRCAVLLVALALVPNVAVWGASYALGPGFVIGAGSVVAPAGSSGYRVPVPVPVLPNFPLLAALPAPGAGTSLGWAVLGLPVLAGVTVAWLVGGAAASGSWRPARAAVVAGLAALGCGAALALLAGWSAGPIGSATLAAFGPVWWATGGAALGWTALVGVPGALGVRWWHVRVPDDPVSWGERWVAVRAGARAALVRVVSWRRSGGEAVAAVAVPVPVPVPATLSVVAPLGEADRADRWIELMQMPGELPPACPPMPTTPPLPPDPPA
ncbi:DUF6350 family protein [Streptomyces sp. H10-C2]|uniref:cell division protein PerM n=1 Tax=unclassified Streptomyces TaxID=2593676 RepID=UPI0024BB49F8|nr:MULTISPECIES: DUF6350 family protein [unclassified Streptomyces]MDJ0340554.1 DUF6350 family protein [Streptomyces sp. PH10-H1]MDJ0370202.1 DUF6350 family protein [Streptomyces sp. H10-C2]